MSLKHLAYGLLAALFPPRKLAGQPVRILITRRGKLGDVLMTTPLLAGLKQTSPDLKLAYLVAPSALAAIENNPYVDELLVEQPGPAGRLALIRAIRRFKPDIALMLEANPVARIAARLARTPIRASLGGGDTACLDSHPADWGAPRHYSEVFLDLARQAGLSVPDAPLLREVFVPSEEAVTWAASEIAPLEPKTFIAIAPGSGKSKPRDYPSQTYQFCWPVERYIEVAINLLGEGFGLVLLGSTEERPEVEAVRDALPAGSPVLAPLASWAKSGALLACCQALLSTDGGLCHLASAVGCPVVALFGPWDDLPGRPVGGDHVVVRSPAPCSPCIQTPWHRNPPLAKCDCLEQITVAQVMEGLKKVASCQSSA